MQPRALKYSEKCFEVFGKMLIKISKFLFWLSEEMEWWGIRIMNLGYYKSLRR